MKPCCDKRAPGRRPHRPSPRRRWLVRCAGATLLLAAAAAALADDPPPQSGEPAEEILTRAPARTPPAPPPPETLPEEPVGAGMAVPAAELPERFATWLAEVEPLITGAERVLFLSLKQDYQRDAFIDGFWKVRDPYPNTPRNELKERWPFLVAQARTKYGDLSEDRARILVVHGRPFAAFEVRCSSSYVPAEVWLYDDIPHVDRRVLLLFLRPTPRSKMQLWHPDYNRFTLDQVLSLSQSCINAPQLQQAVAILLNNLSAYEVILRSVVLKPRPSSLEWVQTFRALSTEVPGDAEPMDATVELAFPGRHQNRTVVQGFLGVPIAQVGVGEFAGYRSHDLQLTGEVIIDDRLFESFRYKFGFPEMQAPGSFPLAFQRYLRPGSYRLILKLEDLHSPRVFRTELALRVPAVDEVFEVPTFRDPRTEQLFDEATAAIAAGETSLQIIPPERELQTGFVRFDTLVTGSEIEKIRFLLDDQHVLTRNRPPFNVEIDLGPYPDLHALRAEGLNAAGEEVASDEILINSGGYRFAVKLVEPRRGKRYRSSLRARAEVEVPGGRSLDRVEFFLNEKRVATLYQEPWVQPVVLPPGEEVAYVRAVAFLPDGNSTEDLVFINAPQYLDELEIQFVELYTTVLDKKGRPVPGLAKDDFTVREDGVEQKIARFEKVESLPIHVGILIDSSASMVGLLEEVRRAALSFFEQAIRAQDRAAVITFNSFPHLAVELTNDRAALGTGLAGLTPEGKTALYDSVMFSLYYFTGVKGQRALLVLSDGKDESSRFGFAETLDYARRAGITIYPIGLRLYDGAARTRLTQLADETGGRSFFIRDIAELPAIYAQIQSELRAQYLIAYQSSNTSRDDTFRAVDLEVERPDAEVKTLSGYYP